MTAVTVALLGGGTLAESLAKKGTQSDVTLYNAVRDGHQATIVAPTQYPEKFPPLLSAVAMADRVVVVVAALSKEFGEIAATLDVLAPPAELRLDASVGEAEVRRALRGTSLESIPAAPLQVPALRESIDGWNSAPRPGPVRVRIDHAFPVKGVGAVALGLVRQGTVRAHDTLRLYPTERIVEVRSIQVHDEDVRSADSGSRVGLALKGIEAEELARGQVLAPVGDLKVAPTADLVDWRRSRYYRGPFAEGQSLSAQVGLQFVPARPRRVSEDRISVDFDRPVAFEPGDPVALADLSPPAGPRIVGCGRAT